MADGRKNNGGNKNAGRKPKVEEQKLIEKLTPLEPLALEALKKGIKAEQNWAVKLFFEYMYGKAKEFKEIEVTDMTRKIGYGEIDED